MFISPLYGQLLPSATEVEEDGYLFTINDLTLRFDTTFAYVETEVEETVYESNAWKEWALVENFTFDRDRGSIPMIADLTALHPYFRDKIIQLIQTCRKKGIELRVVESYRTRAKQAEYYTMGKKYTRSQGGKSKHQYGLAVDLVPIVNGEAQWENKALWKKIGVVGESLGLRWGGRWRSIYDPAHFEWTGGLTLQQLAEGYVPHANPQTYPCMHEDLEQLKKHWDAWENEQSSIARNAINAGSGK